MNAKPGKTRKPKFGNTLYWLVLMGAVAGASAQTCQSPPDMDSKVRSEIETAGRQYFDFAAKGDAAALQRSAIPAIASSFTGIEFAVRENQAAFAQAQVSVRSAFLLATEASEAAPRTEFLCGVFGKFGQTADSAVFVFNNLPPGKYSVVILDAKGAQDARTLTLILQQIGTGWKLAGFYARPTTVNGHDSAWFAQRAREFKGKEQLRNAWLYFREAIALASPADFMSTLATDKLYDESQAIQSSDLPVDGSAIELAVNGAPRRLVALFPLMVGNDLDLVVRYEAADVSDTMKTFQENSAVIRALVAKFPEFRDGFAGVVARAVEPSGKDFGTMLPMKEIK